mmetsp:Transcript_49838/g.75825  ORF Transcript_49838/g.75825 Transcript_49838/m.75825 type:complete len:86 (+) Transcript_49838:235-492(+)
MHEHVQERGDEENRGRAAQGAAQVELRSTAREECKPGETEEDAHGAQQGADDDILHARINQGAQKRAERSTLAKREEQENEHTLL